MIGCGLDTRSPQIGVNLFNVLAGSCINDAEWRPAGQFHHGPNFFMIGCDLPYFKVKVWPIESADDLTCMCHLELRQDIAADCRCGGGSERKNSRGFQLRDDVTQTQIVGTEVVAPKRDAVRFIDRK